MRPRSNTYPQQDHGWPYAQDSHLALRVHDQLPQRLKDDGVEKGQVVEPDLSAEQILDDMSVEEERAELVLQ